MIGKIINNYVIERNIGDGGMGVVYYARHNRVDREVAIKVLHSNLFTNENIRNRFKNEANALIKLNHKNIVQIFDYVEQDNFACLIMEFINGYTLDEYINKKSGPLPSAKATNIISSILDAVQFAHDNNVYHRDIKPGNIMICKEGKTVKIMDFGIAKLTDSSNLKTTHANAQLGTPFYMSPEQVKGLPFTRISDIYSLGVTLFEMVTGKCPYGEITNLFELQSKIVNEPLPPTSLYYPSVTPRLQQTILIATSKSPEQRFQSCNEFKKYLHDEDNRQVNIQQPQQVVQKIKPIQIKEQSPVITKTVIKNPVTNFSVVAKGAKRNYWWVYLLSVVVIIIGSGIAYLIKTDRINWGGGGDNNIDPIYKEKDDSLIKKKQSDSLTKIIFAENERKINSLVLNGKINSIYKPEILESFKNKNKVFTAVELDSICFKYKENPTDPGKTGTAGTTGTPVITPVKEPQKPTDLMMQYDFFTKLNGRTVCGCKLEKSTDLKNFHGTLKPEINSKLTYKVTYSIGEETGCGGTLIYEKEESGYICISATSSD